MLNNLLRVCAIPYFTVHLFVNFFAHILCLIFAQQPIKKCKTIYNNYLIWLKMLSV